ncbi:hypothetical protein TNCV_4045841 [Trichonephila clavipes]|nr:hypothetical protein TNCV_4045841 [Trichonephila clavipes]
MRDQIAETRNRDQIEVQSGFSWSKGRVENESRWRCRNYPANFIEMWKVETDQAIEQPTEIMHINQDSESKYQKSVRHETKHPVQFETMKSAKGPLSQTDSSDKFTSVFVYEIWHIGVSQDQQLIEFERGYSLGLREDVFFPAILQKSLVRNVSISTVHYYWEQWSRDGTTSREPGSRRPRGTSEKDDHHILCVRMWRLVLHLWQKF